MSEFIVTKTLVDKVVEATEYSRDLVGEVLTALKSLEPNLMYVFPAPPMPAQPAPPMPPWSNAPPQSCITDVGDAIREAEKIVRRANDKLNQLEKNSSLKEHERAALSAAITCMNQEGVQP